MKAQPKICHSSRAGLSFQQSPCSGTGKARGSGHSPRGWGQAGHCCPQPQPGHDTPEGCQEQTAFSSISNNCSTCAHFALQTMQVWIYFNRLNYTCSNFLVLYKILCTIDRNKVLQSDATQDISVWVPRNSKEQPFPQPFSLCSKQTKNSSVFQGYLVKLGPKFSTFPFY